MKNEEWQELIQSGQNTFELLFRTARRLNAYAIRQIRREPGMSQLRESHTNLFPLLSVEGTRITEMAEKLGVSKQAVAKQIDELETMGMVEKVPDPLDGRAKLVRFKLDGVLGGLARLSALEREFEAEIGEESMRDLYTTLNAMSARLDRLEATSES